METQSVFSEVRLMLRGAAKLVRKGGSKLIARMLALYIVVVFLAAPVVRWLFQESLRAEGLVVTDGNPDFWGYAFSATMVFGLLLVVSLLLVLQFTVTLFGLRTGQEGGTLTFRGLWEELRGVFTKLTKAGSVPLILYLVLLLPLSGLGFTSALFRKIPTFQLVTGEVPKGGVGGAIVAVVLIVLVYLNVRLALSIPVVSLTTASASHAMRESWHITRGRTTWSLLIAALSVLLAGGVLSAFLVLATVAPTQVAERLAPQSATYVAAFSLGVAQCLAVLLSLLVSTYLMAVLVTLLKHHRVHLSKEVDLVKGAPPASVKFSRRTVLIGLLVFGLVVSVLLGVKAVPTMKTLSSASRTEILAETNEGGDPLSVLDDAVEAGADAAHVLVRREADDEFTVVDDTTEEETSIADYVTHAKEKAVPLLIEVEKEEKADASAADALVNSLRKLDGIADNSFESAEPLVVNRLKELLPTSSVGQVLTVDDDPIPQTDADFLTVDESLATEELKEEAHDAGLGLMVKTHGDEDAQNRLLAMGVDGIITDDAEDALTQRSEAVEDDVHWLSDVLSSALLRFIPVG